MLPGIIVEICRGKTEKKKIKKQNKTKKTKKQTKKKDRIKKKQTILNIFDYSRPSFSTVTKSVNRVIQSVSQ